MAFCADVAFPKAAIVPRRRQHPRYTLRSLAYVKLDQGNGGIVRDLTESGIAIQAVAPMQLGQEINLRFDLLSPRVRVETRGHVAWADSNGQSGIQFDPLPVRLQKSIRDWLLLQMLSAASVSGRDTIFANYDSQFMFSPEPARQAITMDELTLDPMAAVEEIPQVRSFGGAAHYLINNLCGRLFAAFFGPPLRGYAGPAFSASGQRAFE
ncbi:MAG: hypothetical protein DMG93_06120 [Acidobacteria bacterium]|nr:MAG: hypothetical protein DMG93_06120 [Acidobacteriota bacterium]